MMYRMDLILKELMMLSCPKIRNTVEYQRFISRKVRKSLKFTLGMKSMFQLFLITGTGETLTTLTTSHGTRTNTSLNTAVHAGLKVQPQLLLTDSMYFLVIRAPLQLVLMLKLLLTAKLVALAMVETLQVYINLLINTVSLIQAVSNTLLKTLTLVILLTSAEIAHGLLLKSAKQVLINVGQLITRSITYLTTMASLVLRK